MAPLFSALADLRGRHPCADRACQSRAGVRCEYVDRRNRRCPSAWCPAHRVVVDGDVLCRRHASVVYALPASATGERPAAPDLGSRAPSLANWVGDTIDSAVRSMLTTAANRSVVAQPVLLRLDGSGGQRTWERCWYRRSTDAEPEQRVSVAVAEDTEDEVILRVDGRECARLTPPWIARRDAGPDDPGRVEFTGRVLAAIDCAMPASGTEAADPDGNLYSDPGERPRPHSERAS